MVSEALYSAVGDYMVAQTMVSFLMVLMFLLFVMWFFKLVISKSKGKEYRELLADLFVAGKIKQIATKEGINLLLEMKEFANIVRKTQLRASQLDNIIEDDLKQRIADDTEKALEEKKK